MIRQERLLWQVMKALSKKKLNICVMDCGNRTGKWACAARYIGYRVNPQAGIAIDVTFASDHPDTDPRNSASETRQGVLHRGPNINP
jgi:putative aminopeptidase FrvX